MNNNKTLYLVLFFITLGSSIINPLMGPLIFSEQGFLPHSTTEYQVRAYAIIMGIYAFGMILGHTFWGVWADKTSAKKIIVWTLLGSVISYLLSITSLFFLGFFIFIMGRLFDGFMSGRRSVALSIISQSNKGHVNAFKNSEIANALGLLLGPIISGALVNFSKDVPLYYYSLPFIMMLLAVLSNIYLIIKYLNIQADMVHATHHVSFNRQLWLTYVVFFLFQLGWYIFFLSITPYIIVKWNYSPIEVGLFFSCLILLYILILWMILPFVVKTKYKNVVASFCLIIGGFAMALMSWVESHVIFIGANMLVALAMALNTPIFTSKIASLKEMNEQGKAIGFQNSIIGLSWLTASLIIGFIIPSVSGVTFLVGGVLLVLTPVIQYMITPKN